MEFISPPLLFYFYIMWNFEKRPIENSDEQENYNHPIMEFIEKNKMLLGIILFLMVMLIVNSIIYFNNQNDYNKALLKKENIISDLKQTVNKQSEIEIFGWLADESKKESDKLLLEINKTYEHAKKLEWSYEISLLRKKCYKDQINRMVEWKKYSKKYCEESQNLENFRAVK